MNLSQLQNHKYYSYYCVVIATVVCKLVKGINRATFKKRRRDESYKTHKKHKTHT